MALFFCVFAVVAGDAVPMAVPQAREALQAALAPREGGAFTQHLPFLLAFVYWAVSAPRLVARLLLSRRFEHDGLAWPGRRGMRTGWLPCCRASPVSPCCR